jgi:outer membrane protein
MRAICPIIVTGMKSMIDGIKGKVIFLCVLCYFGLAIPSPAQDTLSLNLQSAIDLALQNNETYLIAAKDVDRANAAITEALSGALPQLTAGLTYLRNWEIPVNVLKMGDETVKIKFGTENSYTADLTVTQPIYSGGRTLAALSIARSAKKLIHQSVRQSGQDVKLQVYNGFYGAILANDVYRVNLEAYQLAKDNLDLVQKMYNQGMSAEFDLLRARVAVANLEPAVISARSNAELAMNSLKNSVGIDLARKVKLESDLDSTKFILPPIDTVAAKQELIKNRPEILVSEQNTSIRKKMISLSAAGYKPTLAVQTSLQYQRQYDSGDIFGESWDRSLASAVVLQIPIFDSWRTPSQVKQARIQYQQSKLQDQAIKKGMLLDFEQCLGNYLEARNRLSAQGDAVQLARRGLEIANVRFESGVGTQLEVSDARLSLSQAEINRAVAYHDLAVSYANLLRSLGRDINP